MFDDPPVIDVLEVVARDLLLVGGAAVVRVTQRVRVVVGVEPARRRAVRATQRHLGAERDVERLSLRDGCEAALQREDESWITLNSPVSQLGNHAS